MLVAFIDARQGHVAGFEAGVDGARATVDEPLQSIDAGLAGVGGTREGELNDEWEITLLRDADRDESRHVLFFSMGCRKF